MPLPVRYVIQPHIYCVYLLCKITPSVSCPVYLSRRGRGHATLAHLSSSGSSAGHAAPAMAAPGAACTAMRALRTTGERPVAATSSCFTFWRWLWKQLSSATLAYAESRPPTLQFSSALTTAEREASGRAVAAPLAAPLSSKDVVSERKPRKRGDSSAGLPNEFSVVAPLAVPELLLMVVVSDDGVDHCCVPTSHHGTPCPPGLVPGSISRSAELYSCRQKNPRASWRAIPVSISSKIGAAFLSGRKRQQGSLQVSVGVGGCPGARAGSIMPISAAAPMSIATTPRWVAHDVIFLLADCDFSRDFL